MNQHAVVSKFSHVKPGDTEFKGGGLRDFFLYRDLGIADATGGQVICHLVKANPDLPPEHGTGWHKHLCDFQIVIMTKGWARFMYEDQETLVQAGDVVALTRIPGIGKKTAERMVVELRDRAADLAGAGGAVHGAPVATDPLSEATIALQQLGYKPAEAERMAKKVAAEGDGPEAIIRKALQQALR